MIHSALFPSGVACGTCADFPYNFQGHDAALRARIKHDVHRYQHVSVIVDDYFGHSLSIGWFQKLKIQWLT